MLITIKYILPYFKLKPFLWLIIVLFIYVNAPAQTVLDSLTLVNEFLVNAKTIQADEMGNIYVISPSNQLYKYNANGKILATLNYNYNGNITSIDASNSMEIYVFYKELNKVLLLDNNLAYRGEIDLTKLNITQAAAVARSFDNGIWVFDLGDLQLKKLNKEGVIFQSSGNIKQIAKTDFIPTYITDNTKQIMLCNDSICHIFDVFASLIKTLKQQKSISFQLGNDCVFETTTAGIKSIDIKMGFITPIAFFKQEEMVNDLKWSYVYKENIYLFKSNQISIYRR